MNEPSSKAPPYPGLTPAEVAERVRRGQSNDFEARVGRSYGEIVRDNLLNLFNLVLGTLLVIVLISQDYTTVLFAGFSVVTNSFLGMIQEINAKRKLDRLAALSAQEVRVWRDGKLVNVAMKQIVLDDVIAIEPGDRLVVDGRLLQGDALEIDESHLTGESDAVLKEPDDAMVSGSFCIAGTGLMIAMQVGKDSTINKLSTVAKQYKNVKTPTQHKISALVEISVLIMFIFVPMLFVAGYLADLDFLGIVKNAVVFVTSLVPQGLVLVAILSLTIGAIRISRHQTLIQRVNAVESLANVTVLCFDKTGTLTENRLVVTELLPLNGFAPDNINSKLQVYVDNLAHQNRTAGAVAAYAASVNSQNAATTVEKLREIPFTSSRKWGAIVLPDETLIMGAPERILPEANGEAARHSQALSTQGLRVLAFARSDTPPDSDALDGQCQPIALIVMSDRVRDDIQDTLNSFREQDVDLKVISGDNLETVRSIAGKSGITIKDAYSGTQLDAMSDPELEDAVTRANLFARVEPDTKRRIIAALKRHGEYTAMVGDGVNDVPALKEAHLAIVMNDGAQIAKDVGDIVLLNNAMSTLPLAFAEGKETTQTVYGTTKMFFVKNMYNVVLFLFIAFMSLPFPITPVQISWSAFGTVNLPAALIAFGWVRPKYMKRFRHDVLDYIITAGVLSAGVLSLLYVIVYFTSGGDLNLTRSAVTIFVSLFGMTIVWNVQGVDLLDRRTFRGNWLVVGVSSILAALTILAMYILPDLFEFSPPSLLVAVLIVALFELTVIMVSMGLRNRYLLERMWMLFSP